MDNAGYIYSIIFLLIPGHAAQLTARLVNGNAPWNGRLEILYQGQWGTVCDDNFGKEEAQVACRMLGYNSSRAVIVTSSSMYGEGSGPVLLDDLECLGSETSLDQCQHGGFYIHDCDHREDAGIICSLRPEQMRLTGTRRTRLDMGLVEVEIGSEWNTVRLFGDQTAKVVCRQLSLPYTRALLTETFFGPEQSPQLAVKFHCSGNESGLFDCHQLIEDLYEPETRGIICSDSQPFVVILHNGFTYPPLEGTNFTLECHSVVPGPQQFEFGWRDFGWGRSHGKSLIFDNVTRAYHGRRVQCIDSYSFGAYASLVMQVYYAPRVVRFQVNGVNNRTVTVDEHSNVNILCEANGRPTPHMALFSNTGNLVAEERGELSYSMFDTPCGAGGDYRCGVNNEVGQDKQRITLVVECNHEDSQQYASDMTIVGSITGGVFAFVIVITIFLVRCYKGRTDTNRNAERRQQEIPEAMLSLQKMSATGMTNTYSEQSCGTAEASLSHHENSGTDPVYVNTADVAEVSEESEHEYSEVDKVWE